MLINEILLKLVEEYRFFPKMYVKEPEYYKLVLNTLYMTNFAWTCDM